MPDRILTQRRVVLLWTVMGACFSVRAQQDPLLSQGVINRFSFNPSWAGMDGLALATVHARMQWVGISDFPLVQFLSLQSPVPLLRGGAGLQLSNVVEGAFRLSGLHVAYSYHHASAIGTIATGMSVGILQAALEGSRLRAPEGSYENGLSHNDPLLPEGTSTGFAPDLHVGIAFQGTHGYLGISATHLVPVGLRMSGTSEAFFYEPVRQYYGQAGVMVPVGDLWQIEPGLTMRTNGTTMQWEGLAQLHYKSFAWLGAGVRGFHERNRDAVLVLLGIRLHDRLSASYSFDYPLSALRAATHGSHELLVRYALPLLRPALPGKIIYNPRY